MDGSEFLDDLFKNNDRKENEEIEVRFDTDGDGFTINQETMLRSSYLLSNALLNILIQKNYISIDEFQEVMTLLNEEFMRGE